MDETEIDPTAPQRIQIGRRRFREETRGITVADRRYATTRDSQAQIERACSAMESGETIHWKTAGGFAELSRAQLIAVRTAVRAHVQACFDREAALLALLEAGDYDDTLLGTGWPE